MSTQNMNKKSWESLSSSFSGLEVSLSHDSCYASDEVSVTSTKSTAADSSVVSSATPTPAITNPPFLKPILKRSYAEIEEGEESESGYASGGSEHEYEFLSEDEDEDSDDDDVYYVTCWEDASDLSEYSEEDEGEDEDEDEDEDHDGGDGSFISFESMVRFDTNVLYIEAPDLEDETPSAELTCHELMEMAKASGTLHFQETNDADDEFDDAEEKGHGSISDSIKQLPEEHTSDVVDLDKRLFIAYMNGINCIADPGYKTRLHARVDGIKTGQMRSPYLESDNTDGVYLDHALNHVIGTFPNLIAKKEFDELLSLSEERVALKQQPENRESLNLSLLKKIEDILSERLATDVNIGSDELSFFAGGVAYALENWKPYMVH
ncbi:hypothetical protein BDV29DRAFT_100778 [Aspergillus leporis]|uniref:Uncharacterized protein n=1 Tax=Aspergillus leporis TaxID=41062 RepID=A0A5N5XEQ4_9EURO|nr:hypothetical protein BDV29DRAFT_100778 [Aspergillus leporis]